MVDPSQGRYTVDPGSLVVLLGAGYLLEEAHDEAGPWVTAAGVLVLAAVVGVLGWSLKGKAGRRR